SRYDDVIYTIADSHCGFHGVTWGHEVMLTRQPDLQLLVHELGHAFGLGHAQASDCITAAGLCALDETGDPFSPMGNGELDLSTKATKAKRPWLALGESYRIPGSFRVTLTKAAAGRAEVRFR